MKINFCDTFVLTTVVVGVVVLTLRIHTGGQQLAPPISARGVLERLFENFSAWLLVYGFVYVVMYSPTHLQRRIFSPFKANPVYPSASVIGEEMFWSALSVMVATAWQLVVDSLAGPEVPFSVSALAVSTVLGVWADFHFYCQHRMMHHPALYQRFHKLHHRSKNPNPWSGLSFHPVEATVYFSPIVVGLLTPWLFTPLSLRGLHFGLLLAPCRGHHGYGSPEASGKRPEPFHYTHHVKFNCNFGGSEVYDRIFRTDYGHFAERRPGSD